jgi:YVTN family beta-propeller protein
MDGKSATDQVGTWDTRHNVFMGATTIVGDPSFAGLAVSADGSTLYLADANGKVDFVDASSLEVIASIAVGTNPSGISVSADGQQALITDSTSTSVTVLDLVNQSVVGTVALGAPSAGSVFLN